MAEKVEEPTTHHPPEVFTTLRHLRRGSVPHQRYHHQPMPRQKSHIPSPQNLHDIPVPPIPESQPAFSVRQLVEPFLRSESGAIFESRICDTIRHRTCRNVRGQGVSQGACYDDEQLCECQYRHTPKLLDADLNLGGSDFDGFGNMFESLGNEEAELLSSMES
jgi:hypothetical protein